MNFSDDQCQHEAIYQWIHRINPHLGCEIGLSAIFAQMGEKSIGLLKAEAKHQIGNLVWFACSHSFQKSRKKQKLKTQEQNHQEADVFKMGLV